MATFQKDMTQGSVTKHLLRFSLPFLASNLLQALYSMADTMIVGMFDGYAGAAAVGAGGQVTAVLLNLISGLAVGGTVLIAQFIGARKQEEVKHTIGTMFSLYAIAAAVFTVVMLLIDPLILKLLSTPEEIWDESLAYLNICMGGTVFVFGYNAVSAVLRGMGDSRHPLLFVAIAAVTNVVLDLIFVGPLNMGAAGAAWATIIAQALSFIMAIIFLRRNNFVFDFHPRSFKIHKEIVKRLLGIGLPSSVQGTLVGLSFMMLTRTANTIGGVVGTTALAVASKVNGIAILPAFAIQSSIASMAGQNLGADEPKRAYKTMKTGMLLSFLFSSVIFIAVNALAPQIFELFLGSGDSGLSASLREECIVKGSDYLRSISWDYLLVSFTFSITGLAIGAGQTFFTMASGIFCAIVVRVPAAWILTDNLPFGLSSPWNIGLPGVGYAVPIGTVVSLIICLVYLATGAWKKKHLMGKDEAVLELSV